ncbi:arsenate reductase (azurin) small subunit [Thermithiobacillus plumbiphilus]|uniref:Arsenate reductase (Azurin) small subunit n=1 Tax=Thermithiobacillus plumbiphilus TaxID=1729899 RepID=A0ABU9D785_9PROT
MSNKMSRRNFLKIGGVTAGAGLVACTGRSMPDQALEKDKNQPPANQAPVNQSPVGAATLPYPSTPVTKAQALKAGTPVTFNYPDASSPCTLLKMGEPVIGGVGPDKDIVAYSTLCTHMGCPLAYDAKQARFKCGCHFSMFDPSKGGQMIIGQATENLPQIELEYDEKNDMVRAVAVNGLIYGRQANLL